MVFQFKKNITIHYFLEIDHRDHGAATSKLCTEKRWFSSHCAYRETACLENIFGQAQNTLTPI